MVFGQLGGWFVVICCSLHLSVYYYLYQIALPIAEMSADNNYTLHKTLAGCPRTVRGRPSHISTSKDLTKILYCNGNSIFIRDIEDPSICDVYTQHSKETTCAAWSPSGYYVCSGDASGKVRIWDTVNKEHILKYEYQLINGRVKDIAWSSDSTRIAVCGEGKQSTAVVVNWDTGTNCGNLSGPTKTCNSISIRHHRPYRIALASEDYSSCYYAGPPFKFKTQFFEHNNFVNCVRFSPDGEKFATAGADGKCFIHKGGEEGELIGMLNEPAGKIHKAGVYGISWSADSKHLMTASADKTVKIWNLDEENSISNKEEYNFNMGNELNDMQVGCVWAGTNLISISLCGDLNYLDCETGTTSKVVKGHTKAIIASCISDDRKTLFTASFDGLIFAWDLDKGSATLITGKGHESQVQSMSVHGSTLITCGIDDTVRYISVDEKKYEEDKIVKMDSQPQQISIGSRGMAVVACLKELVVVRDTRNDLKIPTNQDNARVALSTSLSKVALGTESKVIIYSIVGDKLVKGEKDERIEIPTNGNVTDLKFSPDDKYLAICTGKKQVKVMLTSDFKTEKMNQGSHAVKVNAIAWSPDSRHLASCGIDGAVFVWSVEKNDKVCNMRGAHSQSVDVTTVQWSDNQTLLTTGRQDCSIRIWKISL